MCLCNSGVVDAADACHSHLNKRVRSTHEINKYKYMRLSNRSLYLVVCK